MWKIEIQTLINLKFKLKTIKLNRKNLNFPLTEVEAVTMKIMINRGQAMSSNRK